MTQNSPHSHSSRAWPCAIAGIAIVALVLTAATAVTLFGLRQCARAPGDLITTLAGMVRPNINATVFITGTVERVRKQAKLNVMEVDVTAEVEKSEKYEAFGVYWGTTTARVRARGCKVQYYVPLEQFSAANINVDQTKRIVTITVPEPRLNEELIEVPYGNIEVLNASSAWSRFNKTEVAEEAKRMLRDSAAEQGKTPLVKDAAHEHARKVLRDLFQPFVDSLQPDVRLDIEFVPEERPDRNKK